MLWITGKQYSAKSEYKLCFRGTSVPKKFPFLVCGESHDSFTHKYSFIWNEINLIVWHFSNFAVLWTIGQIKGCWQNTYVVLKKICLVNLYLIVADRGIYWLKNIDTFTKTSVYETKMNVVACARLTFQTFNLQHYDGVIMGAMASQITNLTIVYSRRRSKRTSKFRITGLCEGNSPVTGEFSEQMANNAENISIWWRHHVTRKITCFAVHANPNCSTFTSIAIHLVCAVTV